MSRTEKPQRRTRQRTAVAAYLAGAAEFRTAQRIHEDLRSSGESLGLATVYRTLQAMAEAGEVDVLRTADGEASYRRCSATHHHHLVCRVCRKAVEVTGTGIEAWARRVAAEHGFTEVDHELELYGTCADCA
jgi:Fur family ferric uptake transcriptional regulator